MKILHVGESVLGGAGTYINEIAPRQMLRFGEENVRVLVPKQHCRQLRDVAGPSLKTFDRTNRTLGVLRLGAAVFQEVRTFKPDILHAHSTFAGIVVRLLAPLLGVPVVYCPHGWATEMEQPALKKRAIGFIEKVLSFFCRKIIAVSEYERARGVALGIDARKIVTIINGLSIDVPPHEPFVWEDSRLKVLFVGRLDRQKGIDVLLKAIGPLKDQVCAHVVGTSVAGGEAVDFSKYPHIKTFGWHSLPEVSAHIAASDVLVMPSRWEGLPLVALEAMRAGKGVIAASVGGIPEVIVDRATGRLFQAEDADTLRSILTSETHENLHRYGNAGKIRFQEFFTADKMCTELEAVYASICDKTGRNNEL